MAALNPPAMMRGGGARVGLAFAAVFFTAWATIAAIKYDFPIAGFWPANAIALILLMRWRAQSASLGLMLGIAGAMFAANLAAANSAADSAWFTAGNVTEIIVAYKVLRSRVFAAPIDGESMQLVRMVQRLLLAAVIGPAFGALVGAYGLSLSNDAGIAELWIQWWLPSALSMLIVAPFGLLLNQEDLIALRRPRALIDLMGAFALIGVSIGAILVVSKMAMIMLAAPAILYAAVRLRIAGAMAAISLLTCIIVPMAAAPDAVRTLSTWSDPRQLLIMIEAFLFVQGLAALATAAVLNERDALLAALASRQAHSAEQAQTRLRLLMTVAHEIRTPLNAIQGCAELVARAGPLTGKQTDLLDAMKGASQQLQTLASDLLDTARIEQGALFIEPARLEAKPILAEVVAEVTAALPAAERIVMEAPDSLDIWADPLRFRQVASNLISNAVKFAGGYGPIWVTVRHAGEAAVLEVRDQGPGFPPGSEHSAFEPFAQQRRADAVGAGVGLSLVKQLVEAHGGTVRLVSTPYIETRIEASFPHQPSAQAVQARSIRQALDSTAPETIFSPGGN